MILAVLAVAGLVSAAAALASHQLLGYAGNGTVSKPTLPCPPTHLCTYISTGANRWTIPNDGSISGFTIVHDAATALDGSQAVALVVVHSDGSGWKVDGVSDFVNLSKKAGRESFSLATPLVARQGDSLAVTVAPYPGGEAATTSVLETDSHGGGSGVPGETRACASAPTVGQLVTNCNAKGDKGAVLSVSAQFDPGPSANSTTGGSGSSGSTGGNGNPGKPGGFICSSNCGAPTGKPTSSGGGSSSGKGPATGGPVGPLRGVTNAGSSQGLPSHNGGSGPKPVAKP